MLLLIPKQSTALVADVPHAFAWVKRDLKNKSDNTSPKDFIHLSIFAPLV